MLCTSGSQWFCESIFEEYVDFDENRCEILLFLHLETKGYLIRLFHWNCVFLIFIGYILAVKKVKTHHCLSLLGCDNKISQTG